MEVACQWDIVFKTGHNTKVCKQLAFYILVGTCGQNKPTGCWSSTVKTIYSAKQQFWAYGHVTEYRDESILNLEMLNKLNKGFTHQ